MGLVATSFYTLSKHTSIFRRFHLSYKEQKEKRPLLSQDRFLAKIAIVFSARRIPAVFLINSAPWSMRRQNASMLVSRGVREGDHDPLSPLLFILSLEILACYIRQDRNIHGLVINNEEIKLTLFADDVTCFLRDRLSYLHLFVILKFFSRFSGLSVNDDKTELFGIGPQKLEQEEFYHKTCTSIKILGIYFDYHKTTRRNLNFNSILKSIKKNSKYVEMARPHTSRPNSNR